LPCRTFASWHNTQDRIARKLDIPVDELESLIFAIHNDWAREAPRFRRLPDTQLTRKFQLKPITSLLFPLLCVFAGCATSNITVRDTIPPGSTILVVAFRDCVIADQDDCTGSGVRAGSIFASVLSKGGFNATPVARPVGAKAQLTDDAAVAYAKSKGAPYVLNGNVENFYRVAQITVRGERAAAGMRLLQVSDGSMVAFSTYWDQANSLSSPDAIIEAMARKLTESLAH